MVTLRELREQARGGVITDDQDDTLDEQTDDTLPTELSARAYGTSLLSQVCERYNHTVIVTDRNSQERH